MTRLEESRRSFLAARDARHALLERALGSGWPAVIAVSLCIPGESKTPAGSLELFAWAVRRVVASLAETRELHSGGDSLGPFGVLAARADPSSAKSACLAIESSHPAARLIDLDVYSPDGKSVDRASLGLPPRPCLACDQPARECIRLSRHAPALVVSRAHEILADFRL